MYDDRYEIILKIITSIGVGNLIKKKPRRRLRANRRTTGLLGVWLFRDFHYST